MKIMVPYDRSEESKKALKEGEKRFKIYGGTNEIIVASSSEARDITAHLFSSELEKLKKDLSNIETDLKSKGIPCKTILSTRGMSAGEDLVSIAKEYKIDEIILGIRERSRVAKLIMGSVAQYVILKAECIVVCIK